MITPERFWKSYREQTRLLGSWRCYRNNDEWTEVAKRAAENACSALSLKTSREYLRVDVIGHEERARKRHDWHLRVAFEVENGADWKDELCKLSHVVADLCVVAAYQHHATWRAEDALSEYLRDLRDRVIRVPHREWLFVFGPDWRKPTDCWTAYTLDRAALPVAIAGEPPLRGIDLVGP